MKFSTRKRIAAALCMLVMMPLLPFALLALALKSAGEFIEWCFDGKLLSRLAFRACERIEVAFGVDADTEYRLWKERVNKQRVLSEKKSVEA